MKKDFGNNNNVKRKHLNVFAIDNPNVAYETCEAFQTLVNKIERKIKRCEDFINKNKEMIDLSYYNLGYYNGRIRAFENALDLIEKLLQNDKKRI